MTLDEPVLSKEELAAILVEARRDEADTRKPIVATHRPSPLSRALADFADEQSRLSSTIHQRPIRFSLSRLESMPVSEFGAMLTPNDRAFALRLPGASGVGVVTLGRSVLFGWLAMAFGAPANLDVPLPQRGYTRIEIRFLRRLVEELTRQLSTSLLGVLKVACALEDLIEPDLLHAFVAPRLLAAAFEVEGLGTPGRLRVGFPDAWIVTTEAPGPAQSVEQRIPATSLMDVPLEIRAEAGGVELTLQEVGRLRPGDVIPFDSCANGRILVRVAGHPKFEAVLGSAGLRAAIQIVSES